MIGYWSCIVDDEMPKADEPLILRVKEAGGCIRITRGIYVKRHTHKSVAPIDDDNVEVIDGYRFYIEGFYEVPLGRPMIDTEDYGFFIDEEVFNALPWDYTVLNWMYELEALDSLGR